MTRIKYVNGCSQPILCGVRFVTVELLYSKLGYRILDAELGYVIKEGYGSSMTNVKAKAKRALTELGTVFQDEIRNRGKTERLTLE